ncbi:hypothetical protein Tco_1084918 [Tanacetum coccineum]
MAQQVIPAIQLVPRYHTIRRCNNYVMLQSIPCSPECKIVGQILLDHLSYALTATADVPVVYLQQLWRTVSKVPDTEDTIKFCWILRNIPTQWICSELFFIFQWKLLKIYLSHRMLISDEFLTKDIRATDDFKEYETVFFGLDVLKNQPKAVVSTQGMHRSTPRAHKTPTLTAASEKDEQTYDDVNDSDDRLEPRIYKENPEHVDDDDDKEEETVDELKGDETGNKNITQELTDIVSLSTHKISKNSLSKRRISSKYSHLPGALRRMCRRQGYMIKNMERKCITNKYFCHIHKKVDQVLHEIVPQLAEKGIDDLIENNLKPSIAETIIEDRDAFLSEVPNIVTSSNDHRRTFQELHQANDPALWEVLKYKFENSSTSNTSCRDDDIHPQRHDDHQEDDVPPAGEKRVERHKASKSSKSAREDEVIQKDETPGLIIKLQNVDKHLLTIFNRARIEATLNHMLSNQFKNA